MAAFYVGQTDYITQLNILESRIITLPIVIGNSGKFLYTDGNTTSWQTALTITDVNTAVALETTRATTAEALKAPIASPTFTGTVSGITKAMVGLGQVDNTSDINKPVSTATTTAIGVETTRATTAEALKAPIASPTFTGTVSGITKAMVGLDQVDNTLDINKPVSTATTTAIGVETTRATTAEALKAPIASPTFTGTATIPTLNLTNALAVVYGGTGIATAPANGAVDIGNGTGFTRTTLTAGSGISITNAAGSITITATSGGGTVTGVTGTAPVVSSGGSTPAISMAAASAGVNGYMTGAYATKLDGIATGATANTGTVTSVSGTGTVSGLTLSGTVTGSGSLTLSGAIGTLNQNTTGSSGSCTGNAATATNSSQLGGISSDRAILKRRYRIHPADSTSLNTSISAPEMGFTYGGSGEPTGPYIAFGGLNGNIDYSCQLVGAYSGGGNDFKIRTRNDDSAIWNPWRTILTDGNYNSYAPTLTGTGASGTWGINVTGTSGSISGFNNPTTAATGNTIVYRDGSGHITGVYGFFNYLNMSHGASGATTDTVFYSSGDDYIRKNNATGFRASLNVPTRTGGDASGTWGISISGNSATATSSSQLTGIAGDAFVRGNGGNNYGTRTTNFGGNSTQGLKAGFYDISSGTNMPTTDWYHLIASAHSNSGSTNQYEFHIATTFWDKSSFYMRSISPDSVGAWRLLLTNGNYTSYAPSLTGSGASGTWSINVTGSSASCTGNAATATNASNTSSISNAVGGSYTWSSPNYFLSNQNTTGSYPALQAYSDNSSGAIMAFHRGGAFAINMGLDSDNVIRIGGWSASANRLQMDMSGNLTMAGNVTAYSDERLKKDWALLPDNFIEQLAKVKSGTYTRIDSEERQVGVSAQGLQKFLDEAVQTDAEGMLSVNYGGSALAACVELAKRVVEQDARIAKLEALVNQLIKD